MMGVKIELEWKNKTEKMKGKIVIKLLLRDYSFIKDNHYIASQSHLGDNEEHIAVAYC